MGQATFQSTVSEFAGFGVPGTLYNQSPYVASANTIYSEANFANNIFGYACSYNPNNPSVAGQNTVNPGNTGSQVFAGIIANPAALTLFGGTSGPLSPSLVIPNYSIIDVVTEGILVVYLNNAANIGDVVIFNNTTGALYSQAPGTQLPSGYSNANATVYEYAITEAGLATIWIRPMAPQLPVELLIIPETTVTWSGGGATLEITATGVEVGDLVNATIQTPSTEAASLEGALASSGHITFTLSAANTSDNAVIAYSVVRPAL